MLTFPLQQIQTKAVQSFIQKTYMMSLTGLISTYVTICMNQSGSELKIKRIKILFVAPYIDIQMTYIDIQMTILWPMINF